MLSFNINLFKHASFVNFNHLVLRKLIHKPIVNNMVAAFSILPRSFNKLVLLVLSKILHLQLSAHHSKAVPAAS
jgi:hypothetical protein